MGIFKLLAARTAGAETKPPILNKTAFSGLSESFLLKKVISKTKMPRKGSLKSS
jgi:hypothetical protein